MVEEFLEFLGQMTDGELQRTRYVVNARIRFHLARLKRDEQIFPPNSIVMVAMPGHEPYLARVVRVAPTALVVDLGGGELVEVPKIYCTRA